MKHPDGCQCNRCVGFQAGNLVSVRHGANSMKVVAPHAVAIAEELREALGDEYSPTNEHLVQMAALSLARVGLVHEAILSLDGGKPETGLRLSADARGWTNAAVKLLESMGLTPMSKARLELNRSLVDRGVDVPILNGASDGAH